jgi:ribonuclease D
MKELALFKKDKNLVFHFPDDFGPYAKNALRISLKYEEIYVIENEKDFIFLDKFENSKYVGIDLEWRSNEEANFANIIQLADENFVVIADYSKFNNNPNFETKYCNSFKNKTFIGFGFNTDLTKFVGSMKKFMCESEIIDITNLYKAKKSKQCPSLSTLCKELLNIDLCKYEQMSNWNKRPLRLRQLHYAALDAHILLNIFKILNK